MAFYSDNDKGHPDKKGFVIDLGDTFMMAVWYATEGQIGSAWLQNDWGELPNRNIKTIQQQEDYDPYTHDDNPTSNPEYQF